MLIGPKLTPAQLRTLASAFSNISQAIILFSLAAAFVPEAINLSRDFSRPVAFGYLTCGLILLAFSAILVRKEK